MKKLAVALFVALLGFAFTAPVFALENQFGGYWRVRMYNQTNFDGDDDVRNAVGAKKEYQQADTRTRLYYTAVLNDNLKFVNKFEMNADWGGGSYGNIGADGLSVVVKNSYVDFNLGAANIKMGTQPAVIHRAFLFDDDFSGIVIGSGGFTGLYGKITEASDAVDDDAQMYHAKYAFGGEGFTVTPNFTYADLASENNLWYLGLDLDGAAGGLSYWATLIYNGGELAKKDVKAYLLAAGGDVALSDAASLHGQVFYATGDDSGSDIEAFTYAGGQAYYWAEIMGLGMIDKQVSNGSCGGSVSNILAANLGISYKATDKLSLGADIWHAILDEDDAFGEDKLGTEIDLSAKYIIVEGLTMDVVAAYLFAGDATNGQASDDANPIEVATRFSISF